jgi:hypothetical protein
MSPDVSFLDKIEHEASNFLLSHFGGGTHEVFSEVATVTKVVAHSFIAVSSEQKVSFHFLL